MPCAQLLHSFPFPVGATTAAAAAVHPHSELFLPYIHIHLTRHRAHWRIYYIIYIQYMYIYYILRKESLVYFMNKILTSSVYKCIFIYIHIHVGRRKREEKNVFEI